MSERLRCFISHSSVDKPFARRLATDLRSQGIDVWFDEWAIAPGESISDKIAEALRAYDMFLIVITPKSVRSKWVNEELRVAYHRRISDSHSRIVPLLRRQCRLPEFLRDYKYVDFRGPRPYSQAFRKLCDGIVGDRFLRERYRAACPSGIVYESIHITCRVGAHGSARFNERCSFRPVSRLRELRMESNFDGEVINATATGAVLSRRTIRKNAELWRLKLVPTVALGAVGHFKLDFRVRNEFVDRRNSWFYILDSPTRHLRYDWVFSAANAPEWLRCRELQTQTLVKAHRMNRQDRARFVRFRLDLTLPTVQHRYAFEWQHRS